MPFVLNNTREQGARLNRHLDEWLVARVAGVGNVCMRGGSPGVHMQQVAAAIHDQARGVRVYARQAVKLVADGRRPALIVRQQAALWRSPTSG